MTNHKIVIRPSCIIINDYIFGSCIKIENYFKCYNMATHDFYYMGLYYIEDTKTLYLPRGMDIWYIQKALETEDIVYEVASEYSTFTNTMKFFPRDDVQKECLRFMNGLNEYEENKLSSQLSVNLPTGKGKTFVSVYTMVFSQITSIVITYSNGWLKQWKDSILEYTDMDKKDIYQISGAQSISMLLSGKSIYNKAKIFLITHSTIKSYGDTYGWDKITKLFEILKIGNKFIDESHLNFLNISMIDFFTNVAKSYYITATPARSDENENVIYQIYTKNIPSIELFDENSDPHTEYIAIKWNSRPTPQQLSDCRNMYGLDRNKYTNYVVTKPNFYSMLHILMDIVIKLDGRCLFYIGTNDAILKVYEWLSCNYPEYLSNIGIYTTLVDNKPIEKDKTLILSTTKSAGAAEHIEGLKMTIVLAEPFKSEVTARQSLGRTRDKDTLYIELVDLAFKKIKAYYYYKLPTFNKYAINTSDMNIDQNELDNRSHDIKLRRSSFLRNYALTLNDTRFRFSHQAISFNKDEHALTFYE